MKPTKTSAITQALITIGILCLVEWVFLVKLLHI